MRKRREFSECTLSDKNRLRQLLKPFHTKASLSSENIENI